MTRSNTYNEYLKRHKELTLLLALGETLSADTHAANSLEIGVALSRAIVVLLAGHLEAFFNGLLAECVSELPGMWDEMSAGQKKYLALRISDELLQNLDADEPFSEQKQIDKLTALVQKMCGWIQTPNLAVQSGKLGSLKGFYKGIAPESIETLLKRLRPDKKSFFDWLEQRGYDRSRIWINLEQLVNQRTDIAHGDLSTQPTLKDARLYVITSVVVVRLADQFLREVFALSGSRNPSDTPLASPPTGSDQPLIPSN